MEEYIDEIEYEYEFIYNPNTLLKSCEKDNDYNDIVINKTTTHKPKNKKLKTNFFFNDKNIKDNIRKFNPRLPPYKTVKS